MTEIIDLRSDTLTMPTPGMRQAMFEAVVGDDVFGEDPTVRALEEKTAQLLGHEAGLFVPSGTMSNQIAVKLLTNLGDEILIEQSSHVYYYESGGAAIISGVQPHTVAGVRGLLTVEDLAKAMRPANIHYPPTTAIFLENTSNRGGGSVYPPDVVAAIRKLADDHGLLVHMDGARLINACVAAGCAPTDYTRHCHTISLCLSKGLGAPVGSVLVSSGERIARARRWRKVLGGGMRQSGFLAAAGIYALDHNIDRLADDHANARLLAGAIAATDGLTVDPAAVETNIIVFDVSRPDMEAVEFCDRLRAAGVLMLPTGPRTVRAVTHLGIEREHIEEAGRRLAAVTAG